MTVVTWPISPSPVMTGWPTRTPRPLPWSMKTVEYQSVGDCPMTRAETGFVPGERARAVDRQQALELAVLAHRVGAGDRAAAQVGVLALQVGDLALGVDRVAEPADEVARRLQRTARALLDRRDDLEHPALDAVQPATGRLTEVDGEQQQRGRHEQREGYPAPSDRLVVHVRKVLWMYMRFRAWRLTLVAPAAAPLIAVGAVDDLELLERAAGADRHAGERRLGQVRGHLGLFPQALVEPQQQ